MGCHEFPGPTFIPGGFSVHSRPPSDSRPPNHPDVRRAMSGSS